jgi:hypothetical protein
MVARDGTIITMTMMTKVKNFEKKIHNISIGVG